jgi:hypothetical protein
MKKLDGWYFGLVELPAKDSGTCLVLCEIYENVLGRRGTAYVDWKQIPEDKKMILEDISGQFRTGTVFRLVGKKIIRQKRKPKGSKR